MKNLLLIILLLPVFSCNEKIAENPKQNNAVADAESSISGKLESGSRYESSLVDKIYYELIKNDEKLKNFDERLKNIFETSSKTISEKQKVLSKSNQYYDDAHSIVKNYGDSLLKKQTEALIKASSERYDAKTLTLRNLITQLEKGNTSIADHYSAFKIRKTLSEIEKYQNQNPLDSKDLEKLIIKQNQLLAEIKKL